MNSAVAGVKLGNAIARMATKVREDSLGKTTPALVQVAAQVADQVAAVKAERGRQELVRWFERKGVHVPADGELQGLLGALARAGGWLMQNTLSTAIGFGIGSAMAAVLEPFFLDMAITAWRTEENQRLSVTQLADLAARGWIDDERLVDEARDTGFAPERSTLLRRLAEAQLGAQEILELLRRGDIDEDRAREALRRAGVASEVTDELLRLRFVLHSPDEALLAQLQGQLPEEEARRMYREAGGRPEDFEWRFNNRGTAPTPTQALDLLNRGIIATSGRGPEATSYEQAFLEGPWRNKWLEPFLALREYLIPPRSIVPLLRSGAITRERALELMARNGVPPEDALAMTEEAASQKLAPERELAKTELLALYRDGLLDPTDTRSGLVELGYEPNEADLLLGLEDFRWERTFRNALVTRIGNLYRGRKITEDEAQSALAGLGLPGSAMSKYLALWDVERDLPTADLTEAQVRTAWTRGVVEEDYYQGWLVDHGYSAEEAQLLVETNRPGRR